MIELIEVAVLTNGLISLAVLCLVAPINELKGKVDGLSKTMYTMIESIDSRVQSIEERM